MAVTIAANGVTIYTITDDQIKAIAYSMSKGKIQNALLSIIQSGLDSYINNSKNLLKEVWVPIIQQRFTQQPTADVGLANLIFSQPDYLDYDGRNP